MAHREPTSLKHIEAAMTPDIWPLLLPLGLLLAVTLVGVIVRLPTVRGRFGEFRVERALRAGLDSDEYRIYGDVILPSLEDTTQIDHVVVSRFGVFVIETKNLRGLIVGKARDAEWTQHLGRRRHPFQNPMRQNHRHVRAVETALGLATNVVVPLVVFTADCRLHPVIERHVTRVADLAATIPRHSVPMFTAKERNALCARLEGARLDRRPDAHRQHVSSLQRRHGRRQ